MARGPAFRFLHACDFHLELPLGGVPHVPPGLVELFVDAPYRAAERVIETAIEEDVDFVLLAGDLLDPRAAGSRGPLMLVDWFERLAGQSIQVYWAAGTADRPERWPARLALPENVHRFPVEGQHELTCCADGTPLARIVGTSGGPPEFDPASLGSDDLYTIGLVAGHPSLHTMRDAPVDYWALGGGHHPQTLLAERALAHDPGTPQGRRPDETGPGGCTLVVHEEDARIATRRIETDAVRWHRERILVAATDDLARLEDRMVQQAVQAHRQAGRPLVVTWQVEGMGPVLDRITRETAARDLLLRIRQRSAGGPVWHLDLHVDPPVVESVPRGRAATLAEEYLAATDRYDCDPACDHDADQFGLGQRTRLRDIVRPADGLSPQELATGVARLGRELFAVEGMHP